jgi:hypothetical protein
MNVVVIPRRSRPVRVAAAPAAVAGLGVCLVRIGIVGTLVVAVVTVAVMIAALQLYPALYRKRHRGRLDTAGVDLAAEAAYDGRPGAIRIFADRFEFTGARGGATVCTYKRDVSRAELEKVGGIVRATRATLIMNDGRETKCTITAPVEDVERALIAT